jgi:hypothetical protein
VSEKSNIRTPTDEGCKLGFIRCNISKHEPRDRWLIGCG